MLEQVFDKGDVGAYAANTEFAQGTVHPRNRRFGRLGMGCNFNEKAVVIARNDTACIGRAPIKTNAHACGFAEGCDAAIVWNEVVLRVFCGDPCLERVAVEPHVVL